MVVTISKCIRRKELRLFEQLPELIHQKDPWFVPPFPGSIAKIFNRKSPFWNHGELLPAIAYQEGRPVGRICAIVNRAHNEYYKDKTGFFGFFDSIDDPEVANALIHYVKKEVGSRGCEAMRGPYNPTSNDECGLLVSGFESAPMILMPYNPPYYLKLYETLGLKPVRNLDAYYLSSSEIPPEKVRKIVGRIKERSGISVRNINLKNLDQELKIIQKLYNETLTRNWGFVPIRYEELQFAANDLKAIIDPEMVLIAEKNGEPVGFSMVLPNVNEFMWKTKTSKRSLFRILRFLWYMKTSYPKEGRLAVLGVRSEFQASGIAAVFYYEALQRGKSKIIGGELSWVDEKNESMIRSIKLLGGKKYKSYQIFEQSLA